MSGMDLTQLESHNFDLNIRDTADASPNGMMSAYHEMLIGEKLDDEHVSRFEKMLVGLISNDSENAGMLTELGVGDVCASDLCMLMRDNHIPNDEIQDAVAKMRLQFEELVEKYAEQIKELSMVGPVGEPLPDSAEAESYRNRVATFVIASLFTSLPDDPDDQ